MKMINLSKTTASIILLIFTGLLALAYRFGDPDHAAIQDYLSITPMPAHPAEQVFPLPAQGTGAQNVQIIRSLLGVEVRFFQGNINYAAQGLLKDSRYLALSSGEKLVDAIKFQPFGSTAWLLLIAIAKRTNGMPQGVPGKFYVVRQTATGGLILKDAAGRLFYYTGYILATPLWKSLHPGQSLQDNFCKNLDQMAFCSSQNVVNINLRKPASPDKDIPVLTLIK